MTKPRTLWTRSVIPYRLVCIYQEESVGSSLADGATALTQAQYQYNRYTEGKIYYLNDFDINTFTLASDDIEQNKTLATYTYLFNTRNDVLSDAKVRKALSIALSRDEIVNLTGGQHIASTGYVPSGVFNTDRKTDFATSGTQLYNTAGDLDGARSLLSEAGQSERFADNQICLPCFARVDEFLQKFLQLRFL